MKSIYSVEIDRYNPMALSYCLKKLGDAIPDFEYGWRLLANGGGIDYGVFLNINVEEKEIEICNQPEYGTDGDDYLDDVIKLFEENEEEDGDGDFEEGDD